MLSFLCFSCVMKYIFYFFLFSPLYILSQESIKATLIKQTPLEADVFISKNNFEKIYYIEQNSLIENCSKRKFIDLGYSNIQLGNITTVNTFNPLKINVFYKDFNLM